MMHEREKSDTAIVAVKPTNKAGASIAAAAEAGGAKGGDQEERERAKHHRTLSRVRVTQALDRVRQAACTLCRQALKVGAVCGKSARTDLCGGRLATAVPTANVPRPAMRRP